MAESPVTGSRRGYAVIITNENSVDCSKFRKRKGADKDEQNIQRAFCTKLNFEWLYQGISKDLRRSELFHDSPPVNPKTCGCLSCKIQATDHAQSECFLLVISSYGGEVNRTQKIDFSDGQRMNVSELVDMLSDEKCPSLRGKPRILILQACRSNANLSEDQRDDHGVIVNVTREETLEGRMATMKVKDATDVDPFGPSGNNINNTNNSLKQDLGINERAPEQPKGTINEIAPEQPKGTINERAPEQPKGTISERAPEQPKGTINEIAPEQPKGTINERAPEQPKGTISERAPEQPKGTDRHSERNVSNLPNAIPSSDAKAESSGVVEDIPSGEKSDLDIQYADNVYSDGIDIPGQFLIVYPTVSGKNAKRNEKSGSWLIDELCAEIDAHDYNKNPVMNFLKVLTRTTHRVASRETISLDEKRSGLKNAVCIIHRLTKPLVFREIEASAETPIGIPAL